MAEGKTQRNGKKPYKSLLPRVSSPEGTEARVDRRLKAFVPEVHKGGSGSTKCHEPGSRNRKKLGR